VRRIGPPSPVGSRSGVPQSSHETANIEAMRAPQAAHLPTIAVPQVGQSAAGGSPPSKKRCAWPQRGQKDTQSPSV
jgi:hypothetical protein